MILTGDCLERLRELADNSIDSVVTDPPYGLRFMGKKWDYDVPSPAIWREVLRVLKPGAHLLSFGGTRTYHRMVVAIEDAGFEIRDQVQWLYGSGFPKSTNISLRIDKEAGVIGHRGKGFNAAGQGISLNQNKELRSDHPDYVAPKGNTPDAIKWAGWGSALKPANEPIVLARKPLQPGHTIAENVLKYGTGGLNIDASRVGSEIRTNQPAGSYLHTDKINDGRSPEVIKAYIEKQKSVAPTIAQGRFPANLILGCACESDIHDEGCAVAMLDAQSGVSRSGVRSPTGKPKYTGSDEDSNAMRASSTLDTTLRGHEDTGGASRFFKVIKQDKYDTVRPCTDGANVENFAKSDGLDSVQGRALPKRPLEHEANTQCEITAAPIVENVSETIQETGEAKKSFAQRFVAPNIGSVNQDQNARFVASLADFIETSIAQNIAAMPPAHIQELIRCLAFITDSKNSIQSQSLALNAGSADNTDTILTIQSLLKLSGCVLPAIEENINSANLKSDNAPTRFRYQAKASKAERNAGLEGMPTKETHRLGSGVGRTDGANSDNTRPAFDKNHHPCVKPIRLMEYLIRLITPPLVMRCKSCYNCLHDDSKETAGKAACLRDLPDDIQTEGQPAPGQILLKGLPVHSPGDNPTKTLRKVPKGISPSSNGQTCPAILFEELREQSCRSNSTDGESVHRSEGLSDDLQPGTPNGEQPGYDYGTPSNNGQAPGPQSEKVRGGPSPKRNQKRQQNRKPGSDDQNGSRQAAEAERPDGDQLPPLRGNDQTLNTCPTCGETLTESPGICLDPFAGSGSTGVAAKRLGFEFVGIELNAEYASIAEKRIEACL